MDGSYKYQIRVVSVMTFCPSGSSITQEILLFKIIFFFISRALLKERGIKLIEEKVKPAFKKIHDYYIDVSKKKCIMVFSFYIYGWQSVNLSC